VAWNNLGSQIPWVKTCWRSLGNLTKGYGRLKSGNFCGYLTCWLWSSSGAQLFVFGELLAGCIEGVCLVAWNNLVSQIS